MKCYKCYLSIYYHARYHLIVCRLFEWGFGWMTEPASEGQVR